MLKFIVMSDIHLSPEGVATNGLDTTKRLQAAIDSANTNHGDADFCIFAGDLADRGEIPAYEILDRMIDQLKMPVVLTLGNHDHRDRFKQVFGTLHDDENGHIQKAIDVKGYRVIIIDSSEPEIVSGVLCETRLSWLAARLEEAKDRPVIIVMHHHANDLHMPVDQIKLQDSERFLHVLKTHPDIRQVIAGHVHRQTTGLWHGIPLTTISGNHYDVNAHLPGMPGEPLRLDGPAQYAVVLADEHSTLVHFHDYIHRHAEMADGLFRKRRKHIEDGAEREKVAG